MWHSYWSSSFLPNIIKHVSGYQRYGTHKDVFGCLLRGQYLHNKESELSLLHNIHGPPLHLYQISNFLIHYGFYSLHKILASGEIITYSDSCLSCTRHSYWSCSSSLPNIIKICLRVSKLLSAQRRVGKTDRRTDGRHAALYIIRTYRSGG